MPELIAAQGGMHGRVIQRIVAFGGGRMYERGAVRVMKDRLVRTLMKRGTLTPEHVQQAVTGYNAAPSNYLWLTGANQAVLARADCVFLAEFGRFPAGDDFQLNGRYHKICRGLEYNPHYYDDHLKRLRWDDEGNPYVRCEASPEALKEVQDIEVRKGSAWLFALALLAGLGGGPAIAALLARNVPRDPLAAIFVFGVIWVLLFAGLLVRALPRRIRCKNTVVRCSRCNRELDPNRRVNGCSICGILFDD